MAHWCWASGWLYDLGFYDFAGSTVVHSVGGWAALVGVMLLGERAEKYQNGQAVPLAGHNLSFATLGCFILWLGWFGFNSGSTLTISSNIVQIALVTNLSACAAAIASVIVSWIMFGKPDLTFVINGILAGLVAVTASANCVNYWSAIVIGAVAGILVVFSILIFDRLRIDDPVGALSVHLVNGIWGTIAVSLFANPIAYHGDDLKHLGILFGGSFSEFTTQVFGIAIVGITTVTLSFVTWKLLDAIFGLRVSKEAEKYGLDIAEHGMEAYNNSTVIPTNYIPESNLNNKNTSTIF